MTYKVQNLAAKIWLIYFGLIILNSILLTINYLTRFYYDITQKFVIINVVSIFIPDVLPLLTYRF